MCKNRLEIGAYAMSGSHAAPADSRAKNGVLSPIKIMIIRHAEKHQHGGYGLGVSEDGHPSHHELTVRGWERAAALVQLFAPAGAVPQGSPIQTPRSIFASDATARSPSLRAMHTAGPLAAALGIQVNHDYAEGDEASLAEAVFATPLPVLIVWHHAHISKLAKKIAGEQLGCPSHWPEDRFDLIWILERRDARASTWTFSQVAQRLLPGDCPDLL
jgi:phosphohistidine phosphatase SixA